MTFSNNKQKASAAIVTGLSLALVIGNAQATETESFASFTSVPSSENLIAQAFDPPNEGEPTHTVGGASRGSCGGLDFSQVSVQHTASSFSAKLPSNAIVKQVFFSLRDASNNTVYQGFTPVKNGQVLIGNNAFSGVNSLQDNYTWSMAVICGRALRPDSPVLTGNL